LIASGDVRRKKLLFSKKVTKKLLLWGRHTCVAIKRRRQWRLIGTEVQTPPGAKVFFVLFLQKKNLFR
jgi:hypothetical protein